MAYLEDKETTKTTMSRGLDSEHGSFITFNKDPCSPLRIFGAMYLWTNQIAYLEDKETTKTTMSRGLESWT